MSLEELINNGNKTGIILLLAQPDRLWGGGQARGEESISSCDTSLLINP